MKEAVCRCAAMVYRRDTYRYTGRGKSGFEMHYNRGQCSRWAKIGGYCAQHSKFEGLPKIDRRPASEDNAPGS
jgi:hypothetical protein